jgi:transposase
MTAFLNLMAVGERVGYLFGSISNDFNDAQAIHEAVIRPNKWVVTIKTEEQQDMQLLHNIAKAQ